MNRIDLSKVETAGEGGERIKPGAYGCTIVEAKDYPQDEYLEISFDVTEKNSPYKDYYKKRDTVGKIRRYYTEKALPFFKGFILAVESANPGYKFNFDENTLAGKKVVLVFGEHEYVGKDGDVKIGCQAVDSLRVEKWRSKEYQIPKLRTLEDQKKPRPVKPTNPTGGYESKKTADVEDEDMPF